MGTTTTRFTKEKWVFLGLRTMGDLSLALAFHKTQAGKLVGRELYYSRGKVRNSARFVPGGIYVVEASRRKDGTSAKITDAVYESTWEDKDQVSDWQAEHDIAETSRRIRSIEKREKESKLVAETLKPLRRLYRNSDATGRAALEGVVLKYLRMPVLGILVLLLSSCAQDGTRTNCIARHTTPVTFVTRAGGQCGVDSCECPGDMSVVGTFSNGDLKCARFEVTCWLPPTPAPEGGSQ